jgi:hypothetical protein
MRTRILALALVPMGMSAPRAALAQEGGARAVFRVVDAQSHQPVADATVVLDDARILGATDSLGVLRASRLDAGAHAVRVGRLGYEPWVTSVTLTADAAQTVNVAMQPVPSQLPTVGVTAQGVEARLLDFERRRAQGQGVFFTREQLDSNAGRTLVDLLRARSQARFVRAPNGAQFLASGSQPAPDEFRGPPLPCLVQLYVNGTNVFVPDRHNPNEAPPDLQQYEVSDLAAVEFYAEPSQTPPEFRSGAPECGTLVLWTR